MFVLHSFMQPAVKLLGQVNTHAKFIVFLQGKRREKEGKWRRKKQKGNERNTNELLRGGGGV